MGANIASTIIDRGKKCQELSGGIIFEIPLPASNRMKKDRLPVDYGEAIHIEKVRNKFFTQLKKLVQDLIDSGQSYAGNDQCFVVTQH